MKIDKTTLLKWWLLLCSILLGFIIRVYAIESIPKSLYIDEVAMLADVKSFLNTGRNLHGEPWYAPIYFSYGDYKLPVYIWFATLVSSVIGPGVLGLKLPSILAGVGTAVFAGIIARKLYAHFSSVEARYLGLLTSDWLQLGTTIVVLLSPWDIVFSRAAFEGHLAQFFLTLSVWSIVSGQKKDSIDFRWLLISVFYGAVATYTYFSVRFVWPAVFVSMLLAIAQYKSVKVYALYVILPVLLFFALLIPMHRSPLYEASNEFRLGTASVLNNTEYVHQANSWRQLAGNTIVDRVLFHRYWIVTRELLLNYSDNLSFAYLFIDGDPNLRHGTQFHGLFLFPWLPLLLLGIYFTFRRDKKVSLALIAWWLVALLPASVPQNTPHALRSLNALTPLSLLISFGGFQLAQFAGKKNAKIALLGLTSLTVLFSLEFLQYYFTFYPTASAGSWYEGKREVAQAVLKYSGTDTPVYILDVDDKFYMWLYAYGDLASASTVGEIPRLDQLDVFHLGNLKDFSPGTESVIVGTPERIRQIFSDYDLRTISLSTISATTSEPLFTITKVTSK